MERKDLPLNDDPQLDARLREHLAAPALPAEAFTHAVLARLPAAPTREELEVFAAQEAQAKTQRGWAVASGALTGAVVFFLSGRDIDWSEHMRGATDAAHAAVSHAVLPAATPLAIAAALTLGVLAFVFWSSLRRWALRQWEQFA